MAVSAVKDPPGLVVDLVESLFGKSTLINR